MKIAFDVNNTLIKHEYSNTIVEMLKLFKRAGHYIIVWSTLGKSYVDQTIEELGIEQFVDETAGKNEYSDELPDIAIDDKSIESKKATINIKIS
jgi:hydroxymethylpyrimidine pyrophosphatase-like HAD family hydrolase